MNLQCRTELALAYKASHVARILSEDWCARELYCPACDSDRLSACRRNQNLRKIVDAGYEAMLRAIRGDKAPNLLVLQYSSDWLVNNLTLVPRFFFSESVIEKRAPLSATARRAGWVGCNILLSQIPDDGKIAVISQGIPLSVQSVRKQFSDVQALGQIPPSVRGWTTDVLALVRRLGKKQFFLNDLYMFESELRSLHPHNRHIRPKIRQQLQLLRDMGFISFTTPGSYKLRS
jgi:type II restriction enzyme